MIIIRHNPKYLQMKIVVLGFSIEFAIIAENFEIKWAFRAYFVDFVHDKMPLWKNCFSIKNRLCPILILNFSQICNNIMFKNSMCRKC